MQHGPATTLLCVTYADLPMLCSLALSPRTDTFSHELSLISLLTVVPRAFYARGLGVELTSSIYFLPTSLVLFIRVKTLIPKQRGRGYCTTIH